MDRVLRAQRQRTRDKLLGDIYSGIRHFAFVVDNTNDLIDNEPPRHNIHNIKIDAIRLLADQASEEEIRCAIRYIDRHNSPYQQESKWWLLRQTTTKFRNLIDLIPDEA